MPHGDTQGAYLARYAMYMAECGGCRAVVPAGMCAAATYDGLNIGRWGASGLRGSKW